MTVRYGSVCSGIEAATVAWSSLGWEAAWLSEIEPFPKAVLAHHYPKVPDLGDMTALPELIKTSQIEAPQILVGGTPCQSFSVAGARKSLEDQRGNLALTYVRIADAIDDVRSVRGLPGVVTVWENVPGVFTTKDNAFGCLLGALAGEDVPLEPPGGKWKDAGFVLGPKRAAAWRCLDAQYAGLAQRRKRVFLVSGPRDWFRPQEVLFEFEGSRRDTPPSRETRQSATPTTQDGFGTSDSRVYDMRGNGDGNTVSSLVGDHASRPTDYTPVVLRPEPVQKVLLFDTTQVTSPGNYSQPKEGDPCHPLAAGAHPPAAVIALQDVREIEKRQNGRGWNDEGISYTVDAAATQGVVYGCDLSQKAEATGFKEEVSVCVAPGTHPGHGTHAVYPIDMRNAGRDPDKKDEMNRQGVGVRDDGDPAHTLSCAHVNAVTLADTVPLEPNHEVIAFKAGQSPKARGLGIGYGISPTLTSDDSGSTRTPTVAIQNTSVSFKTSHYTRGKDGAPSDIYPPLTKKADKGDQDPLLLMQQLQSYCVRRLTPEECESLQGFPRGYTRILWKGKPVESCPDGPRYKACGNSMAVTVMAWIGKRIDEYLKKEKA